MQITTKPQDTSTLSNFPAANFWYDRAPVTEDWGNLMDHGTESDHGMDCRGQNLVWERVGKINCFDISKQLFDGKLWKPYTHNFCYDRAPVTEDWGNLMDHGTESDHGMDCRGQNLVWEREGKINCFHYSKQLFDGKLWKPQTQPSHRLV